MSFVHVGVVLIRFCCALLVSSALEQFGKVCSSYSQCLCCLCLSLLFTPINFKCDVFWFNSFYHSWWNTNDRQQLKYCLAVQSSFLLCITNIFKALIWQHSFWEVASEWSHLHGSLGDCSGALLVKPLKALLQRVHLLEIEPRRLDNQIELGVVLSVGDHLYALVGGVGDLEGDKQWLELADFWFELRAARESVKASPRSYTTFLGAYSLRFVRTGSIK